MVKREFQKEIVRLFTGNGFVFHENRKDVRKDCADNLTRVVIRIPDMTRGFLISAQFRDFGICSGKFHDSAMRWYEFENSLAFGKSVEYSKDEIAGEVQKVLNALQPILASGKEKIKEDIDQWTFGPFDEKVRNDVLVYFGFPGIDPYSEAYMTEKVDFSRTAGFRPCC